VLLAAASSGEREHLERCVQALAVTSDALTHLLDDVCSICTYDPEMRTALPGLWPWLMELALDSLEQAERERDQHTRAIYDIASSLIPRPQIEIADKDPDATLTVARADWIHPELLESLIGRWIELARGNPQALDALIDLIQTASSDWQARTGLSWVDDLIDCRYQQIAGRSFSLPKFLSALHTNPTLGAENRGRLQRIVDGLVAAGDRRALATQIAEE
jgi:hypothetical protein